MITGTFLGGTIAVSQDGVLTMGASVSLHDDQLGAVGQRGIPVTDPTVIAQVEQFLIQMMPLVSQTAGFEVTMPVPTEPENN